MDGLLIMCYSVLECHFQGLIQWCDLGPAYKQTNTNIRVLPL